MNPTMHNPKLLAAALLLSASGSFAAAPQYLILDHSAAALMDKASAMAIWKGQFDAALMNRLVKLYPLEKFGFISQVEGGFTADKTCVVTARAMMVPRSGKSLLFKPSESATAFDAKPGATLEQCKALAEAKLKEAITAVGSSLIAP